MTSRRTSRPMALGQWEWEKLLGKGAFGMVNLWKNIESNEKIAIKSLNLHDMSEKARQMWQNEVKFIREANHPNIVAYRDIPLVLQSEYPMSSSLGMEYCSRGDLRKFLANSDYCCGLPEAVVRYLLSDMSAAVSYLHQKKGMHRDLKPENIVLQEDPTRHSSAIKFKITDLGYAKDLNEHSCGRSFVGTLYYLAPELNTQARDALKYSQSVDYWSLGLLSYEVITGYRPFCPNYEPVVALPYVIKKQNEHIAIILERSPENNADYVPRHITGIPKPHNLNPHLATDLSAWLQLMLHVNPETRGGGDHQIWSAKLQAFLSKKYIEIINTSNMTVSHFEIYDDTSVRSLMEQIASVTQVASSEQLLLKKQGDKLDVTKKIIHTLNMRSPNLYFVYLYSLGNADNTLALQQIPDNLKNLRDGNISHALGNERQLLACAYDFYMKCHKWIDYILDSVSSLIASVGKHGMTLQRGKYNLDITITIVDSKRSVMEEIRAKNEQDFQDLKENYGYIDEEYDILLQNARTELQNATINLSRITNKSNEIQALMQSCNDLLETVKRYLKQEWNSWRIADVKRDYETKRREIKESRNKFEIVQIFINEHIVGANNKVNDFIRNNHKYIFDLCKFYIAIHTQNQLLNMEINDELKRIQQFPQQEALRKGIWKQIQPIADISRELSGYDTAAAYNAVEDLNMGIDGLLNVELPVLNDVT